MLNVFRRSAITLSLSILILSAASCAQKTEETAATPPPETAAPPLTDANIAAIVVAANTTDIRNAELAASKATNPEVKKFAEQMATDHTAVNKQAVDLVTKLNVAPEENSTSQSLVQNADATRATIAALSGAEFDKAYIDNEVAYHEAVINMLDTTLIPGATNAELKGLLEASRPAFVAHLEHAKTIQANLAK